MGPLRLRSVPTNPGPPRVAYAVGRPVGGAVERNRLRRRLRAQVREHVDLLSDDTAYLLSAGPRASAMSVAELAQAIAGLLSPLEGS